MKIDVLTADDVKFKRWRWWSDWVDVAVFSWASGEVFLLQMKISRTNAKSFATRRMRSILAAPYPLMRDIESLTQMKNEP